MATLVMSAAEREVNGIPYVQLINNGTWMPRFGLGTFRIPDNATCKDAVLTALRMGNLMIVRKGRLIERMQPSADFKVKIVCTFSIYR